MLFIAIYRCSALVEDRITMNMKLRRFAVFGVAACAVPIDEFRCIVMAFEGRVEPLLATCKVN